MTITEPGRVTRRAASEQLDEVARRTVEQFAKRSRIPGMSLAVATPDRQLFAVAVGLADLATRRAATIIDQYPWFSMTKIATATAAVQLNTRGALDLDAPIGAYLPTYRPHRVHGHPTTRQLLTHTAGLANPVPVRWVRPADRPEDAEQHRRIVARYGTPRRTVGTRPRYSNIGYLLAGEVIE